MIADLCLVLLLDASGSVDAKEWELQAKATAEARSESTPKAGLKSTATTSTEQTAPIKASTTSCGRWQTWNFTSTAA